jgi:hypothetical protein
MIEENIVDKEEDTRELQHHFNATSTLFQHTFWSFPEQHTRV